MHQSPEQSIRILLQFSNCKWNCTENKKNYLNLRQHFFTCLNVNPFQTLSRCVPFLVNELSFQHQGQLPVLHSSHTQSVVIVWSGSASEQLNTLKQRICLVLWKQPLGTHYKALGWLTWSEGIYFTSLDLHSLWCTKMTGRMFSSTK